MLTSVPAADLPSGIQTFGDPPTALWNYLDIGQMVDGPFALNGSCVVQLVLQP